MIFILNILIILFFSQNLLGQTGGYDKRIKSKNKELSQLKSEISNISKNINSKKESEKSAKATLSNLDKQISLIKRYIHELSAERSLKEAQVQILNETIAGNLKKIEIMKRRYARRVRQTYKKGVNRDWELLIMAENPGETLRRSLYLNTISTAEKKELQRLKELILETDIQQTKLAERLEEVKINIGEEKYSQTLKDKRKKQKAIELKKTRHDRNKLEYRLKKKQEDVKKIASLIADLNKKEKARLAELARMKNVTTTEASKAFARKRGSLNWPVHGKVTAKFGLKKNARLGTVTQNPGIDISASEGTFVKTVMDGIVANITWIPSFGNTIIIDHGNGYYSVYAHLDDIHVEMNEYVESNTTIGTVGDSGSLTGFKLHFEIWNQKEKLDPLKWLK